MGKIFLEHSNGPKLYNCAECHINLTNKSQLISTNFRGGKAHLFKNVINITYGSVKKRAMSTGDYMIRDVFCKNCNAALGWMYEFALEENRRYKEGNVLLELAYIIESEGFTDCT